MNDKLYMISSFITKDDIVLDIGTDHAYLPIYLKKNNLCKEVYASDVSENVLKSTKKNIIKNNVDIKLILSDGFKNINEEITLAVISGMGTHTILDILNTDKLPNKLILSSNNDYYLLRKELNKYGYYLLKEEIVFENNKYYPIMLFIKSNKKNKYLDIKYGKSNNNSYYKYLINKNNKLIKKVPFIKKINILIDNILINIKRLL